VHKADVDGDSRVSESEYILFKLQQMQKLDSQMLDRLIDRYRELDVDGSGFLTIGLEIPSGLQVAEMQRLLISLRGSSNVVEMWASIQAKLKNENMPINPVLLVMYEEVKAQSVSHFATKTTTTRSPDEITLNKMRSFKERQLEELNRLKSSKKQDTLPTQPVQLQEPPPPRARKPVRYFVGSRVEACDEMGDDGIWEPGVVTSIDSDGIYVTKDGWDESFVWAQVRPLADRPVLYSAGDRVEACDDLLEGLWEPGAVTSITEDGVYVLKDGWDESFVWAKLRPASRAALTARPASRAASSPLSAPRTTAGRFEADLGAALSAVRR
jgi:hypothetical protein